GKAGMSRLYLSNPCAFFHYQRTRCCGRSRRPAFPAPSSKREQRNWHHSGENEPRERAFLSSTVVAREGGRSKYSRDICVESRSRSVLDTPLARGMTAVCGEAGPARSFVHRGISRHGKTHYGARFASSGRSRLIKKIKGLMCA